MSFKKIGKSLLYPHLAVMITLIPVATVFLIFSMIFMGTESPVAIASYVLAAYTLTVWCFRIPDMIRFFKSKKIRNKYARRFLDDTDFRLNVSLYSSLLYNVAYALLQLGMGFWHRSFWFFSLAGYYISLAVMRFFLLRHTKKHKPGENLREELSKFRTCGIVFLVMNLALSLMVFFMVYWNRTFNHHEITTIAMATYTFTSLTLAIINMKKYRNSQSPVYTASKAISLAAACVSLLTLESTMLTTFGADTLTLAHRRIFLGVSGAAVSLFIIVMAIYIIVQSGKKLSLLAENKGVSDE